MYRVVSANGSKEERRGVRKRETHKEGGVVEGKIGGMPSEGGDVS